MAFQIRDVPAPLADRIVTLCEEEEIARDVRDFLDLPPDATEVVRAASFAAERFAGHYRFNPKEPSIHHALRVTDIVRRHFRRNGMHDLSVALLHDILEKTSTSFTELAARFGNPVAQAVQDLSKPAHLSGPEQQRAYEQQILHTAPEVQQLKIADLLDNVSTRNRAGCEKTSIPTATRFLDLLPPSEALEILRQLVREVEARREQR